MLTLTLSSQSLFNGALIRCQKMLRKLPSSKSFPWLVPHDTVAPSYTVVVSQDIYWVGETTAAIPVLPAMPPGSRIPLKEAGVADVLVRLHGRPRVCLCVHICGACGNSVLTNAGKASVFCCWWSPPPGSKHSSTVPVLVCMGAVGNGL